LGWALPPKNIHVVRCMFTLWRTIFGFQNIFTNKDYCNVYVLENKSIIVVGTTQQIEVKLEKSMS
jgi:hypothetical protein